MSAPRPVAPELRGIEVRGTTRASFLMRGVLGAAGAFGAAAAGPFVDQALGQPAGGQIEPNGAGDIEILNFAWTLEILEAEYYERALRQVSMSADVRAAAKEIASNEREHADFLAGAILTLGGKVAKEPEVTFPFAGEGKFLKLAQTFEDTGVAAYNGAAPLIESKSVLANAGRIAQVEGRHAAAIRMLRGQNVADSAFDGVLDFYEVVARVKPYVTRLPFSFRRPPADSGGASGPGG